MLDNLGREQAAQGGIRKSTEVGQRVPLVGGKTPFTTHLDHFVVGVDSAGGHTAFAEEVEKLPSTAPDIQDVGGAVEVREVGGQARTDVVRRPAVLILEQDVLVAVERLMHHVACRRPRVRN